jgi:hypothetical protein
LAKYVDGQIKMDKMGGVRIKHRGNQKEQKQARFQSDKQVGTEISRTAKPSFNNSSKERKKLHDLSPRRLSAK